MLRSLRFCACLLAGVVIMTTAAFSQDVHEYRLDNGLLVLLKENHNAPVVNLNVVYRVGSKYERPGITGISHLLEHMMFKTSDHMPLGEFDRRLKSVGADNNAYTWLDQTVYYETVAADKVETALELEAERMQYLSVLPEDHELEMPVVMNELVQRDDTPFTTLYTELLSMAFKAHPYNIPTIGWTSDVEGITTEDIRAYYHRYYQPDNAFIVAVGDFDPDAMFALIEKYFAAIPAAGVELPRLPVEPPQLGERRFVIERAGPVDYLGIGWHIPESEHPDSYALVVLGQLLGQGRTSRLYQALVDTGQCAMAQSWSSSFSYADPHLFLCAAAINPGNDPAAVEEQVYAEVERIIADGVSDQELDRAKKQARVSFVYDKDSIEDEAGGIIAFELMSSYADIDKYLPGIEAVTSDDVKRVAAEYLVTRNRTVGTYLAQRPEAPGEGGMEPGAPEDDAPHYYGTGYNEPVSRLFTAAADNGAAAGAAAGTAEGYATVETLPNGLTLVIRENHNNQTVNVHGLVEAGKIDDPAELPGLGNFCVSMLSNGTDKHTKLELAEIMEDAGLEMGFSPSREYFTFSGRSLTEDFELLLDLLAEQLLTPSFPMDEIEKTRQQISTGLLNSANETFDASFYTGRDLLYGADHPFAGRVEGNLDSVAAITNTDLAKWHSAHVIPDGAVLTIVGDIDTAAAREAILARFGDWHGEQEDRAALLARSTEFQAGPDKTVEINLPDKSNCSLLWIGPGVDKVDTAEWAKCIVTNFILGGDFSSRLNERLRVQEGLTYGAFSWFSNGRGAGPFCVSVQVNPQNIEAAVAATNEVLAEFAAEGATAGELELARNYLTGNFPVRLATNGAVAAALTDAVYLGKGVDYLRDYAQYVSQVTLEDIRRIAAGYMAPDELATIAAGTISAEE